MAKKPRTSELTQAHLVILAPLKSGLQRASLTVAIDGRPELGSRPALFDGNDEIFGDGVEAAAI